MLLRCRTIRWTSSARSERLDSAAPCGRGPAPNARRHGSLQSRPRLSQTRRRISRRAFAKGSCRSCQTALESSCNPSTTSDGRCTHPHSLTSHRQWHGKGFSFMPRKEKQKKWASMRRHVQSRAKFPWVQRMNEYESSSARRTIDDFWRKQGLEIKNQRGVNKPHCPLTGNETSRDKAPLPADGQ